MADASFSEDLMMRRIAAAAVSIVLLPAALRAQDLVALCRQAQHPPVGAWSEFRMVGGREDGATVRISIVGSERREGASTSGWRW
jgi:phage terminase large subunit-like protein